MIHRSTARAAVLGALLLGALPAAVNAQYQRAGSFHVRPASRSAQALAVAFPEGSVGWGALLWGCEGGGVLAGLRLDRRDSLDVDVELRFDGGEKETFHLARSGRSTVWITSPEDGARLAERVRGAQRLVAAVPPDTTEESGTEYAYSLDGAGDALDRLACGSRARGRQPGDRVLAAAFYEPWINAAGRVTDADAVERPRVIDTAAFSRYLFRHYPPDLFSRGVGGTVEVKFRVLADGQVDAATIEVVRSSTHPEFNPVAANAVKELEFAPGTLWGRPEKFWVVQPVRFAIQR